MTVELNTERIYTELSWLRQEVQMDMPRAAPRRLKTDVAACCVSGQAPTSGFSGQTLRTKLDAWTPARRTSLRTEHPHVVRSEGVHGGRPFIRGTGVSVQTIVEQTRLGRAPAQIVEDFDGVLTLAQVYDALSYFYEHQAEIEEDIARNRAMLHHGPQIASPR